MRYDIFYSWFKDEENIENDIIRNEDETIPELPDSIGISKRNIEKNIAKLKIGGNIERIGARKEGHWKIVE